jgi:hypothetical protein
VDIITRSAWGARAPKSAPVRVDPSRRVYFVVHHSGAPATQTVRAIQDWCTNAPPHGRGFSDIDYNFLVRATTGEIYEGRGWDIVGAHTTGYNTTGAGVCVIGNDEISDAAKRSVRWLYEQYNTRCRKTLAVRGHRQLATTGTTCPGDTIYAWVTAGMPAPGADHAKDDDMSFEADQVPVSGVGVNPANLKWSGPNALGDARDRIARTEVKVDKALALLTSLAGKDFTDEKAIIAGVLAGVDAKAIAAAIPAELADQVASELAARLAS